MKQPSLKYLRMLALIALAALLSFQAYTSHQRIEQLKALAEQIDANNKKLDLAKERLGIPK